MFWYYTSNIKKVYTASLKEFGSDMLHWAPGQILNK